VVPGRYWVDRPGITSREGSDMDIVVRLRPEAASALGVGTPESAGLSGLASVLAGCGAEIKPQFPGIEDPSLADYYTVSGVPDPDAEHVTSALLDLDEVEAAYTEPTPHPA
jgi:hypothetical protein